VNHFAIPTCFASCDRAQKGFCEKNVVTNKILFGFQNTLQALQKRGFNARNTRLLSA
jgi:hypothetical protein